MYEMMVVRICTFRGNCVKVNFFSAAQDSMDEESDDYWRRSQVQADLRPGYLLSGNP